MFPSLHTLTVCFSFLSAPILSIEYMSHPLQSPNSYTSCQVKRPPLVWGLLMRGLPCYYTHHLRICPIDRFRCLRVDVQRLPIRRSSCCRRSPCTIVSSNFDVLENRTQVLAWKVISFHHIHLFRSLCLLSISLLTVSSDDPSFSARLYPSLTFVVTLFCFPPW